MTTAQRNAIASPAEGLMIFNTTTKCLENWNATVWKSRCGVPAGPGIITDCAGTGRLKGTYKKGTPMTAGNFMILQVKVNQIGTYTISSNTVNGIKFSINENFTTTGIHDIILYATGTPTASGSHNFTFTFGSSTCNRSIAFEDGPPQPPAPDLSINCTGWSLPYRNANQTASGTVNGLPVTATFSDFLRTQSTIGSYNSCGVNSPTGNRFWLGEGLGGSNASSMKIKFNREVSNLKIKQLGVHATEQFTFTLKYKGNNLSTQPTVNIISQSGNCNNQFQIKIVNNTVEIIYLGTISGENAGHAISFNIGGVWFDEVIVNGKNTSVMHYGSDLVYCVNSVQ